jgi:DNA replication protein DnaC
VSAVLAGDRLEAMLTRVKLTAIRDQLDSLLDEAVRADLSARQLVAFLCDREIARKDQRRIEMAMGLARLPFNRDSAGFDFAAQPSPRRPSAETERSARTPIGENQAINRGAF